MTSRGSAPASGRTWSRGPRSTATTSSGSGRTTRRATRRACWRRSRRRAGRARPLRGAVLAGFGSGGMPIDPPPGRGPARGRPRQRLRVHAGARLPGRLRRHREDGLGGRLGGGRAGLAARPRPRRAELRGHPALRPLREPHRARGHRHRRARALVPGVHEGATRRGWWRRRAASAPSRAAGPTSRPSCPRPATCTSISGSARGRACRTPERQFEDAIADIRRRHPGDPARRGSCWSPCPAPTPTRAAGSSSRACAAGRTWRGGRTPHGPTRAAATDANILRAHGIPTARVGMARVPDDAPMPDDFSKGMNVVSLREMERLTRCLVYVIVDTCLRSRREIGLDR